MFLKSISGVFNFCFLIVPVTYFVVKPLQIFLSEFLYSIMVRKQKTCWYLVYFYKDRIFCDNHTQAKVCFTIVIHAIHDVYIPFI